MTIDTQTPQHSAKILHLPAPAARQLSDAVDILDHTPAENTEAIKTALNNIATKTAAMIQSRNAPTTKPHAHKPHAAIIAESLDPVRARNLLNAAGSFVRILTAPTPHTPETHAQFDFLGCHAAAETWRIWQANSPHPAPARADIFDCFGVLIGRMSADGRVWLINPLGRDQLAHTPSRTKGGAR